MTTQHSPGDKVIVITGANRGIGLSIARYLQNSGYNLIAGVRHPEKLTPQERINGVHYFSLELRDQKSIENFTNNIYKTAPNKIFGLINNAGVSAIGPVEEFPLENARDIIDVNLLGAAAIIQQLLPLLRKGATQKTPSYIINVGSLIAEFPLPFQTIYAASKGALRAFSLSLSSELAEHRINVTLLEPGDIATLINPTIHRIENSIYSNKLFQFQSIRKKKMSEGTDPDKVAQKILTLLSKKNPPLIAGCSNTDDLLRFIRRLLPDRLAHYLILLLRT